MGFEYRITIERVAAEDLDRLLREVSGFAGIEQEFDGYTFRTDDNTGKMPNAEARLEPGGLYFCDYGGGEPYLSAVLMSCLAEYGEVAVSKLGWE